MSASATVPGLDCPACTAAGLVFDGLAAFECQYCGTVLAAQRTVCPACSAENLAGADQCFNCDEPLSIVASVLNRQGVKGLPLWLRRLRSQVGAIQVAETQASARRFELLMDVDRRRLKSEAEDQARSRERDRQLLFYGAAGILGLILLMLVIAAIGGAG
jgi:hypothetical protein